MSIIFSGATVCGIDHIKLIIHRSLVMILGEGNATRIVTGLCMKKF